MLRGVRFDGDDLCSGHVLLGDIRSFECLIVCALRDSDWLRQTNQRLTDASMACSTLGHGQQRRLYSTTFTLHHLATTFPHDAIGEMLADRPNP